jgi:hypothetical protein
MDTAIKPQPTIQLINVGRVAAKPAGELQVGDVLRWNYGYTSTVTSIVPRGKTQIIVGCCDVWNGYYARIMSKTRLVAVKGL